MYLLAKCAAKHTSQHCLPCLIPSLNQTVGHGWLAPEWKIPGNVKQEPEWAGCGYSPSHRNIAIFDLSLVVADPF